jgi:hypothetical protein
MAMLTSIQPSLANGMMWHDMACASTMSLMPMQCVTLIVWTRKLDIAALVNFTITDYVDLNALVPSIIGTHTHITLVLLCIVDALVI